MDVNQDRAAELIKRDNPDGVMEEMAKIAGDRRLTLSELFRGDEHKDVREAIKRTGSYEHKANGRKLHVQTRERADGEHEIMAIAAVSRDMGQTQTVIDAIADFANKSNSNRATKIQQYWNIYETEGPINNAVNKMAALISGGGRYKVKAAKKGKAKKQDEALQAILNYFVKEVNAGSDDPKKATVATGEQSLKQVTIMGVRHALVEGDWFGRTVWQKVEVGDFGSFSLPMTIQTISSQQMEPVDGLQGLGELWLWKPDEAFTKLITQPSKYKEVNDLVKKTVGDSKLLSQIKADGQALLTPGLVYHVRHRGKSQSSFGESYIEPAKLAIRYSRAIDAADLVSLEQVINRLLIVQVGSSDPKSPYSKSDVAAARAALMQSFFEEPGPSMTIVWQGDDVKVESVGAENVLALADRHALALGKIKIALGVPDALLSGTSDGSKAAGWASVIGAAAQLDGLQSAFAAIWRRIGMRIALENNFEGVELEFEFDQSLLVDKEAEREQNRNDYLTGYLTIQDVVASTGRDPQAVYERMCMEKGLTPGTATWQEAFAPPQGLPGQGAGAPPGQGPGKVPGNGRPKSTQTGKPTAKPKAKPTTTTETK